MENTENSVRSVPAPWSLQGHGYILLYRFRKGFVEQQGAVPAFLQGKFAGGFGSVMLVDYASSDAGPYGELLFIPGKFRFGKKRLDTISRIYVSTQASVVNGRANWGIPKEQADFRFEQPDAHTETASVAVNGVTAARFSFRFAGPRFPVSTKLLPFPLVQESAGKHYFTRFSGSGMGQFAKISDLEIGSELFPNVSACRPIAVIRVDPFRITFPKAEIR